MYYNEFKDKQLSGLGFGCMRLPVLEDGSIDEPQVFEMVKLAMDNGVNYFDTAYPYHGGMSEIVVGKALKQYPRDSFYLATKYPGHQIAETYDPAAVFEEQLEKCQVDYFDFYLLHNVYENCMDVYTSPKWGIIDYFVEQKKKGRIKHLGFSSHAQLPALKEFVEKYGQDMEFCQIQLNFLDWTLQDAKGKVEYLNEKQIPIWVMEPLRGGKLAEDRVQAFRFLQSVPGVTMILSGMSALEHMKDNISIFKERSVLAEEELQALMEKAEGMKNNVPCTACRYCCDGCPQELNIPHLLSLYNEIRVAPSFNIGMTIDSIAEDKRPSACVACGACKQVCPQNIDIPAAMEDFAKRLESIPHWADICKEREEAARKLREMK